MNASPERTDTGRLIGFYRSSEDASRDMLAAAIDDDWNRVAGLQRRCEVLVSQVRRLSGRVALSPAEQHARMRIMRGIVRNEAQLRRLSQPWSGPHDLPGARAGRPPLGGHAA